jgi:hypothetical protein
VKILKLMGVPDIFEIRLYGRDDPDYDYRQSAIDMGLENIVKFYSFCDNIYEVYDTAHCFLLPSRGEGLSNSLLEAMSMQLPVIATRVSGTEDVIENHKDGLLIPADSSEKLADAMLLLMNDRSLAMQLGANARAKVETQYSLESVANRYSRLYNQLSTDAHISVNNSACSRWQYILFEFLTRFGNQYLEAQDALARLNNQYLKSGDDLARLNAQYLESQKTLSELNTQYLESQENYSQLNQQLQELDQQNQELDQQNQKLDQQNQKLTQKFQELIKQYQEISCQYDKIVKEYSYPFYIRVFRRILRKIRHE